MPRMIGMGRIRGRVSFPPRPSLDVSMPRHAGLRIYDQISADGGAQVHAGDRVDEEGAAVRR
jgi:hypothetical protein